jgi:condensin complex subunit 2
MQAAAAPAASHAKMTNAEISALLTSVIKMSTSNKITQNNCWSLQLTENLTEILGGSSGASTFQTAASAIDASVKIFAMRVDSVHQETFKLQSGLNRTEVGDDHEAADQGGAAAHAENEGERPLVKTPKRKPGRLVSTLVKNESDLDVAGFDMQYEEDPLVRKASSAFDTGGAKGLLLNQLSVYDGVTLVFDSGDAPEDAGCKVAAEDTALIVEPTQELRDQFATLLARIGGAELCPEVQSFKSSGTTAKRDDFLQAQLEKMQPANVFPVHQFASQQQQQQQVMSSQIASQASAAQPQEQVVDAAHNDDMDDLDQPRPMDVEDHPAIAPAQQQQPAGMEPSQQLPATMLEDDYGGGYDYGGGDDDLDDAPRDFDADGNIISSPAHHGPAGGAVAAVAVQVGAQAAANPNLIVENNGQISDEMVRVLVAGMDETGYYKAKPTNWTGPEHWNFKGPRAVKQAAEAGANDDEEDGGAAGGAPAGAAAKAKGPGRKKKADAQFFIDFSAPANVDWEVAFAPPKRGNTKLTKSTKDKAKSMSTVLPADVHYGPNVLMSLFTKPKWMIPKQILSWKPIVDPAAQGQVPIAGEEMLVAHEQDVAQAESATAWFDNANNENGENMQFSNHDGLHDDDYDNGADEGGGFADFGRDDNEQQLEQQQLDQQRLLASSRKSAFGAGPIVFEVGGVQRDFLVAEPQRVEQIQLSYAKVARAVDVKTLKASIWRALSPPERRNSAPSSAPPPPETFQALLNDLPARIPKFEQSNVTIPFCFISLLHLANEKGLELQSNGLDHLAIIQH